MLIRHLEFLVTLAEEQHFGRAADLCGVSQPALSLAIRKLEEHLGTPLILRGRRFTGLTAEGEKAVAWGRRIMVDYGNLRDDIRGRRKGGLTGTLRVGLVAEAVAVGPELTRLFEARNPLASVSLVTLPAEEITQRIIAGTLDGGVVGGAGPRKGAALTVTPIRPAAPRFACRADHPFAPDDSVPWELAATQPLCLPEGMMAELCRARGLRPAVVCSTLDAVLAHLRHGLWCSVVPDGFAALLAPDDDIVLRPMPGEPMQTLGLVLSRRDPPGPMARALAEAVSPLIPA